MHMQNLMIIFLKTRNTGTDNYTGEKKIMNTLQDIKRDELNQIKFINKIKLKIFMKKNKNIKIKQKKQIKLQRIKLKSK